MTISTRCLGTNTLKVGAIGYGAMSFGSPYGQGDFDKDTGAREILDMAEELGVTLLDTHPMGTATAKRSSVAQLLADATSSSSPPKFGIVAAPFRGGQARIDGSPGLCTAAPRTIPAQTRH